MFQDTLISLPQINLFYSLIPVMVARALNDPTHVDAQLSQAIKLVMLENSQRQHFSFQDEDTTVRLISHLAIAYTYYFNTIYMTSKVICNEYLLIVVNIYFSLELGFVCMFAKYFTHEYKTVKNQR